VAGAFAEFERSLITHRIHAGLDRARKAGKTLGRAKGSRSVDPKKLAAARKMLATGAGINKTALAVGLGNGTVERLKREAEPAAF